MKLLPGRAVPRPLTILLLVLLALVGYAVWQSAPPRTIVIETGPVGGGYYDTALKYAAYLSRHGIQSTLRPRADSLGIIDDVGNDDSGVDVGFTAQEVDPAEHPGVQSLGRTEVQPLYIFATGGIDTLTDLRGHRIVMPPQGSATTQIALRVLALFKVTPADTPISFMPIAEATAALSQGRADAGLFVLSADNGFIRDLMHVPGLHLLSMSNAVAISRLLSYLQPVSLPAGVYGLVPDLPPRDTVLLGAPVDVVVRRKINPALAYDLLAAMTAAHRGVTLTSDAGIYPTPRGTTLPLLDVADRFYKNGVPWLYRELPGWLATLLDRNLALLLALLVVTQIFSSSKYGFEFSYLLLDYLGLAVLLYVHRHTKRRRALSLQGERLVHLVERMLMRPSPSRRRRELIDQINRAVNPHHDR